MRPLFRPGDRIVFVLCRVEELRRGDVIIFTPPGGEERVVHRVVSIDRHGVRTRGDANPHADPWDVRQEELVGRAVAIERGGRVLPVVGGRAGHLIASCIRMVRKADHIASHVLSPCYRGLARSGLFRAMLPAALRPRVVTFEREGTREMQLFLGRRVIGRRPAGAGAWTIRRPFRIFVDERALP
ncbi:MAG: signal peptidase I [Syntrophaceae bacterium]|nr:signal peptidase I [Syntrophaceae bacterium]